MRKLLKYIICIIVLLLIAVPISSKVAMRLCLTDGSVVNFLLDDNPKCKVVNNIIEITTGNGNIYSVSLNDVDKFYIDDITTFVLDEDELTDELQVDESFITDELIYRRTFNNTQWQALYVPFAIRYDDLKEKFDVAYINDFHQFDEDEDGMIDAVSMEVIRVKSGSLYPNHPYMIKAKNTGLHEIRLHNVEVKPTEENILTCSSMTTQYFLKGTYKRLAAEDIMDSYCMSGGGLKNPVAGSFLRPCRWYLSLESRDPQFQFSKSLRMKFIESSTTDVENVRRNENSTSAYVYTIDGKFVAKVRLNGNSYDVNFENLPAGSYIIRTKDKSVKFSKKQ